MSDTSAGDPRIVLGSVSKNIQAKREGVQEKKAQLQAVNTWLMQDTVEPEVAVAVAVVAAARFELGTQRVFVPSSDTDLSVDSSAAVARQRTSEKGQLKVARSAWPRSCRRHSEEFELPTCFCVVPATAG